MFCSTWDEAKVLQNVIYKYTLYPAETGHVGGVTDKIHPSVKLSRRSRFSALILSTGFRILTIGKRN